MSLMQSRQFTISTYDPPSTPIALKAQQVVLPPTRTKSSDSLDHSRRSAASEKAYFELLKNNSANKTPEVNRKVLPWVTGVVTEGYEPPEGMFGPYDSRPASRYKPSPPTQTQTQTQAQRSAHPFAYNARDTLPLSALTSEINVSKVLEEQAAQQVGHRPESDVLSRGAGLLGRNGGERDSANSFGLGRDSVGMGTFGREASQDPVSSSEALPPVPPKSPAKTPKGHRKPAPSSPATVKDARKGQTDLGEAIPQTQPNVQIHHEHPFSPTEALRNEAEAMAHVEALDRLVGAVGLELTPTSATDHKGHGETYETTTSVPSFGHLWHQDGMPVSRHISYDQESPLGPALFHIPFGPNIGPRISGPDILFERHITTGAELLPINESPESGQRREDRSAYVETVQDEDEPEVVLEHKSRALSKISTKVVAQQALYTPARTKSGIQPHSAARLPSWGDHVAHTKPSSSDSREHRPGSATPTGRRAAARRERAPDRKAAPAVASAEALDQESALRNSQYPNQVPGMPHSQAYCPSERRTAAFDQAGLYRHEATTGVHGGRSAMSVDRHRPPQEQLASTTSNLAQNGSPRPAQWDPEPLPSSASLFSATTTHSNVKHIIAESKFHDETLCQLLDAARLNLIGEEAKKALNRAARARVIELRDMRVKHGVDKVETPKKGREKKHKQRNGSKESKSRKQSNCAEGPSISAEEKIVAVSPSSPHEPSTLEGKQLKDPVAAAPDWAQEILKRLSAFDARFSEMEKQTTPGKGGHTRDVTQDVPASMFNDMIFNTRREDFTLSSIEGIPIGLTFPPMFPFSNMAAAGDTPQTGEAHIHTISSDEPRQTNGTILSWGSNADVELPTADVRLSPPKREKMVPTINIQAPTESNIDKSVRNASGSQGGTTKTVQTGVGQSSLECRKGHPTAIPDPTERDLPPPPSESIRSHRPSPVEESVQLPTLPAKLLADRGDTPISIREALQRVTPVPGSQFSYPVGSPESMRFENVPDMMKPAMALSEAPESGKTIYKTAIQSKIGTMAQDRGKRTVNDQSTDQAYESSPWELVTQRLYSWAVVWEDGTFSKAMEDISLNKQVGEFALTIFVMMTFKRMLKRNLSETPYRVCDKLFVPPTFAEAINQAVHAQQYKAAQQMLEELWYPFLFKDPPRVIIALTKHLHDPDTWIAHRFDLATGHLRSYRVTHEEQEHDGRPFRWWHAIRLAWPQYKIRDPMEMGQQTITDWTAPEDKANNSLRALNMARNLFLGFRPEHPSDMPKLRESVWLEVKRLREKKRGGKLMVEVDGLSHKKAHTGLLSPP